MSFYKDKTAFLKTMSLKEAYNFLAKNIGWLHNPDVKILRKKSGLTPWINNSGSKTTLFAPHLYQEYDFFRADAKPIVYSSRKKEDVKNTVFEYKQGNLYHSIDQIYIDLLQMAVSKFPNNMKASRVAGTLLGYSKEAIDLFTIRNGNNGLNLGDNMFVYDDVNGITDTTLGAIKEINQEHLDFALSIVGKVNTIFYTKELDEVALSKLIKELTNLDLLAKDFHICKLKGQDFGSIKFIMKRKNKLNKYFSLDNHLKTFKMEEIY